eukprot:scaffold76728_cov36-Attheya_sp.AAC.2
MEANAVCVVIMISVGSEHFCLCHATDRLLSQCGCAKHPPTEPGPNGLSDVSVAIWTGIG